jgi:hypothetical protein
MCVGLNLIYVCSIDVCKNYVYWIQPSLYVLFNPSNTGYMLSKLLYRKSGDQVQGRQGGLGTGRGGAWPGVGGGVFLFFTPVHASREE